MASNLSCKTPAGNADNLAMRVAPSSFSHSSEVSAGTLLPKTQASEPLDAVDLLVSSPGIEAAIEACFDDAHNVSAAGPELEASLESVDSDALGNGVTWRRTMSLESLACSPTYADSGTADATMESEMKDGDSEGNIELKRVASSANARHDSVGSFDNVLSFLNSGKFDKASYADEIKTWNRAMEGDGCQLESKSAIVRFSRCLLHLAWFDQLIATFIIISAITIGLQGDHSVRQPHAPMPFSYEVVDTTTTIIFAVELMFRVIAEGKYFVSCGNRHLRWNALDTFLVVSSIFDEMAKLMLAGVVDIGVVRIVRFCRMVRVIRIIRVMRFFQDLRVMVYGILISMKSLLWALLLLVMIAFMFAAFILEFVASEVSSASSSDDVAKRDRIQALNMHFGSLVTSIFSLFKAITGGISWGEQAQPLTDIHPLLGVAFACYVAFAVLCVLNIVTGIFVDNSSKLSMKDEETLVLESAENKARWIEDVSELFRDMGGSDGFLNNAQFERGITDLRVQAKLKKLGLDIEPEAMLGLFDVLDFDKSGQLTVDEFTLGIKMLHGNAKSIDIARLLYDNMSIKKDLHGLRILLTDMDTVR
eukprot:TRINITY_DN21280_c0_g1_i5.p1 TRINITY_DN21280_c0_g1~~TRINITY_DN21280_c0_g1_i5.p1  ORF type:complete len:642 (-),score=90.00 TRINITY_DN21280_c0_g1_i5:214-1986(-)